MISEGPESLATGVTNRPDEASEEYYSPYEGYQIADALLSLRDSAAAKSGEDEEDVYDEQPNWQGYQCEGEEQIYPPRFQQVCNSKRISTIISFAHGSTF